MILTTLDDSRKYEPLSPHFAKAFAFLRGLKGGEKLGRHEIDGDNAFALVQKYTTKTIESTQFEAHRKYIDVQYVHGGRETIIWAPLASMKEEKMAYDEKQEAALFKFVPDMTHLRLSAGHFAVLYPDDAHAPCIQWDRPDEVFKVVIKVKVS